MEFKNDEINYHRDFNFKISSEKTLIEREPNDPSPTIDAQFRVIGKQDRYNTSYIKNNGQDENINDGDDQYIEDTNLIPNDLGSARGIDYFFNNSRCFFLPGVPKEMKRMFDDYVINEITNSLHKK